LRTGGASHLNARRWVEGTAKTTYRVEFDNAKLIEDCAKAILDGQPITKTHVQFRMADIAIGKGGVEAKETATSGFTTTHRSFSSRKSVTGYL